MHICLYIYIYILNKCIYIILHHLRMHINAYIYTCIYIHIYIIHTYISPHLAHRPPASAPAPPLPGGTWRLPPGAPGVRRQPTSSFPPGHLWRGKWTALSGPLLEGGGGVSAHGPAKPPPPSPLSLSPLSLPLSLSFSLFISLSLALSLLSLSKFLSLSRQEEPNPHGEATSPTIIGRHRSADNSGPVQTLLDPCRALLTHADQC